MDKERFNQLATNSIRWAYQVHRLLISAQLFHQPASISFQNFLSESQTLPLTHESLENVQHYRAYSEVGTFLYGMAIENACKTRQILDGAITAIDGELKGGRRDHNILEMVRAAKLDLNDKDEAILQSISFITNSMAKYPIAKNTKIQSNWKGVSYQIDEIAVLTMRILNELLPDEPHNSIIKIGVLSGMEDKG